MEEHEFFVQKVSALSSSYSTDCTQEGWVYICKTKAGNRALWQHYFTEVLLPIIVTSRKAHERAAGNTVSADGPPLPFNLKTRSMLCSDGEAIIMNALFTPFVLAAFKAAEVDYLKLGPSCTKVQQAWDAGTLFRDAKCGLKFVVAQQYKLLDERFRHAMFGNKEQGGFFSAMFAQFPNPTLKAFWSAKQQERLVYSLELIKKVLERSHTAHKMKASFETTGHFPLNFKRMIMKCSRAKDITEAELEIMMKELPAAAEEGLRNGMRTCAVSFLSYLY